MNEQAAPKNDVMHKVACQIVERRNLIFLIVVILLIFSVISRSWVSVENDLTTYLPETSGTRQALDIMEEEFTTYGTADVMVANIGPERAQELADQLAELKGVQTVDYDETSSHYNNVSALYSITFDYPEEDEECLTALDEVENFLAGYDLYVSTSLGDTQAEIIAQEVNVIMVYVAIIVVAVLIFTSQTYAEIPVLLLTFVISMVLNSGTNFLFGTISFVSNSVTSILQLEAAEHRDDRQLSGLRSAREYRRAGRRARQQRPGLGHCDRRSGRGAGRRHRSDPAQEKSTCKAGRRITAHALLQCAHKKHP